VSTIAKEMQGLQTLAVTQYTPVVEAIIASRSRDIRHIEHTLDGLLDFACHPAGLQLFKALCRYYYRIAPPPRWITSTPTAKCTYCSYDFLGRGNPVREQL
jgi:hypothetical protein